MTPPDDLPDEHRPERVLSPGSLMTGFSAAALSRCTSAVDVRCNYIFEYYFPCYVTYLVCVILIGTFVIYFLENGVDTWVQSLYLATSAVTMTGLSPVDFPATGLGTHICAFLLIVCGSPMLLSIVPVLLRRRPHRHHGEGAERRYGGAAFVGLPTTKSDEQIGLKVVLATVLCYYVGCQLLGWLALALVLKQPEDAMSDCDGWLGCEGGKAWPALFLATSAFHNAGLVTLPAGLPLDSSKNATPVLVIVMLLILLGNTFFPIALRNIIRLQYVCTPRGRRFRRVLRLLLKYPRTCYTHLFPDYATSWLSIITPLIVIVQILALSLVDFWAEPGSGVGVTQIMEGLTWPQRILATIFQSVSTRTAGFSVLSLDLLSPTSAFVLSVCMWVSVCPVVVVMRSTTRTAGRASSQLALGRMLEVEQREKDKEEMQQQLSSFMSENSVLLLVLFFLVLLGEEHSHTGGSQVDDSGEVVEDRFLRILFEFASAYGTVGLSMSSKPWSASGAWCPTSQLCLMVVMLLGRLRGLPESIDPTVRFREVEEDSNLLLFLRHEIVDHNSGYSTTSEEDLSSIDDSFSDVSETDVVPGTANATARHGATLPEAQNGEAAHERPATDMADKANVVSSRTAQDTVSALANGH
eukprot:TRINITY_DN38091_c0_g1_i1.p1 TRINITY_DN38091_c0_g1~~TRINITY_DN38091_c0_g1_i1.p1  ORF type:complete len:638 (+),score=45.51 TRINITY_DN38091_c0_g1_i1:98-2011(+)